MCIWKTTFKYGLFENYVLKCFCIIVETLDENKLAKMDDFIISLTADDGTNLVQIMLPYIRAIEKNERPNWRHDLFIGKKVVMNGKQLRKHHLTSLALDTAEFSEDIIDAIMEALTDAGDKKMFTYYQTVVLPTVLYWIVIGLGKLDAGPARFYLANGGRRNAEEAIKRLEQKSRKLKTFFSH